MTKQLGKYVLEHDRAGPTSVEARARVLDLLEQQLAHLDAVGARKAAAHLDAAIEQLRRELEFMGNQTSTSEPPSQHSGSGSAVRQRTDEDGEDGTCAQMGGSQTAQSPEALHIPNEPAV